MNAARKPIFLLADSQSLFRRGCETPLPALQAGLQVSEVGITRAAYIGASNGDAPAFFEVFLAAMDGIDLHETRLIGAGFDAEDREFLELADFVVLAGGDVDEGWNIIRSTGMDTVIARKYFSGAVLMGVSAGAMQLGMGWRSEHTGRVSDGLRLVPYYIDVHGERDDWPQLRTLVHAREDFARGLGIPLGGAMIFHPDMSMEAIRHPVTEFERSAAGTGRMRGNLVLPAPPLLGSSNANGSRG